MCSDFLSLVLQAAGGAISATADDKATSDTGVNVMIAGLSTQVASLFLFMLLAAEFAWRVRTRRDQLNENFANLRSTKLWSFFILGMFVSF